MDSNPSCSALDYYTTTLEIEIPAFDILHYLFVSTSFHRRLSCHQHEQNDAQRPDVASFIVLSAEDLWSHVVGCTYYASFGLLL